METIANGIFERFRGIAPEADLAQARIQVRREGQRLIFMMGEGYMQRARLTARAAGTAGIVAGLALTKLSLLWGLVLVVSGACLLALEPRLIRQEHLLDLDCEGERLIIKQPAAGAGTTICIEQIAELRGVYETQGWDGRSVIYAMLTDGTEAPVLVFPGTDEPLAECACRTLGLLLDLTATYAGPFGGLKTCYERR